MLFSAGTGIDWSHHDLDKPLGYYETDASRSGLLAYTERDPSRTWTLRDIFDRPDSIGGLTTIVGGPETVADELERYGNEAGVDGFNLSYALMPGTFADFVRFVMPELRRRGRVRPRVAGQPLRQQLFPHTSGRLPPDHPGSRFRQLAPTAPTAQISPQD